MNPASPPGTADDTSGVLLTGRLERPGALRLEGAAVQQLRLRHSEPTSSFYPEQARSAGLDGSVVVDLLINAAGQVQEAQVITESPPGEGFGIAALDAAKTYEFENRLQRPVLMSLLIQFLP